MKTRLSMLAFAVASSAWADTVELDTLRIQSAPVQATLGNIVVGSGAVERYSATTMKDVFKGTSSVTGNAGSQVNTKLFVNGIEESNMTVTIDGATQNKGGWHHQGNVLIDPELLKRVEISGLAPADAGTGAVAGFIKYELKDAGDLLAPGETFGSQISIGSDTNASGVRSSIALFGRAGVDYLVNVTRQDTDAYEDANGVEQQNTATDLTDVTVKLTKELDAGSFHVTLTNTVDEGERALSAAPPWSGASGSFARTDTTRTLTGEVANVRQEGRTQSLGFESTLGNGFWNPSVLISNSVQKPNSLLLKAEMTHQALDLSNRLMLKNGELNFGLNLSNAEGRQTKGSGVWDGGARKKETIDSVGIFVQNRSQLNDKLSVSYGARFDQQDFEGVDSSKLEDSGISANVQGTYALNDRWSVNAGYASTWGGYEIGEATLYTNGGGPITATSYGSGADQMKATESTATRLGLSYEGASSTVTFSAFETDIENLAPMSYDRSAGFGINSQGVSVDFAKAFDSARIFGGVSHIDVSKEIDGVVSDASPTATYEARPMGTLYTLGLDTEITSNVSARASVQGASSEEVRYQGRSSLEDAKLDSYAAVDLGIRVQPASFDGLSIALDLLNATDELYSIRGTSGTGDSVLNEAGRTLQASVKYRF